MTDTPATPTGFQSLGLPKSILKALDKLGYEVPTPIQTATIPPLLEGRDLVGQAQTGTGKTAAFALPLLARLDLKRKVPQVLVLTPTRELSIQVAEAFQRYASGLDDFHVAPIYGGQDIVAQLKKLRRGLHVVVGTPGRVMDHMRRGTLKLDALSCIVLDEADEMLRMGFIDDIELILGEVPDESQVALFSATMPAPIRRIAHRHLENPVEIAIEQTKATSSMIRQRYWMVDGMHKLSAMTRILEAEKVDAVLVFVRTKTMTTELATRLESQGFAALPLSGDLSQSKREETVARFKSGKADILIATDVAARGLDIDRISHVINYDIPHNAEAYIHRIGRTGRAGRSGEAILFVAPREKGLLFGLKKAMGGKMEPMTLPTARMVHDVRVDRFKKEITKAMAGEGLDVYRDILATYCLEESADPMEVATALAVMLHAEKPLGVPVGRKDHDAPIRDHAPKFKSRRDDDDRGPRSKFRRDDDAPVPRSHHAKRETEEHAPRPHAGREVEEHAPKARVRHEEKERAPGAPPRKRKDDLEVRMERYRIDVGSKDGLLPGELVGVIAAEAGLERRYVGRIDIAEDVTFIELPEGMPPKLCSDLKKLRIAGKVSNFSPAYPASHRRPDKKHKR